MSEIDKMDFSDFSQTAPTLRMVIENFRKFAESHPDALDKPVVTKTDKGYDYLFDGRDFPCECTYDSQNREVETFGDDDANAVCIGY